MGYRLYLSALWLLAVTGALACGSVLVVQLHDHVVVREDRACFVAWRGPVSPPPEVKGRAAADEVPPKDIEWEEVPEEGLLARLQATERKEDEAWRMLAKCHLRSLSGRVVGLRAAEITALASERAWLADDLDFSFDWLVAAASLLAFLPAILLSLVRRWWLWVRAGAAS